MQRCSQWKRQVLGVVGCGAIALIASAQSAPITFQYYYDDLNQLIRVNDSTGVSIQYMYDAVGNILQMSRSTVVPGALNIFNLSSHTAATGDRLTIQGQGFSVNPLLDIVTIGNVTAEVISATSSDLVIKIPLGATSGAVSVALNGLTASSSEPLTVLQLPLVTSVLPLAALAAGPIVMLTVNGANLGDATFRFQPSGPFIEKVVIGSDGTSASVSVSLGAALHGRFTLVATNAAGNSDVSQRLGFIRGATSNTLTVPGADPAMDFDRDELTNAQEIAAGTDPLAKDTDGDGFPDGIEIALRSDPRDAKSTPSPASYGLAPETDFVFSVLNQAAPYAISGTQFDLVSVFSVLNRSAPYLISGTMFDTTLVFSVLNRRAPDLISGTAIQTTSVFSALNVNAPYSVTGTSVDLAQVFSVLNSVNPVPSNGLLSELDFVFSILNGSATGNGVQISSIRAISWLGIRRRMLSIDSRGDGLPDDFRTFISSGAPEKSGPYDDADGDGLTNIEEWILGTNPLDADTDRDGLPDGVEIRLFTNPLEPDTDHDGFGDGDEVISGTDPLDPRSFPKLPPSRIDYLIFGPSFTIHNIAPSSSAPGAQGASQQ